MRNVASAEKWLLTMIDFSPYQVWFYRDTESIRTDTIKFVAIGPNSLIHGDVGNASRLANGVYADSWLELIKAHLDNYEDEFLTFAESK